jgi:hypothetical protein
MKLLLTAAAGVALAIAGAAAFAQNSHALANAEPGLWELTGVPGAKTPVRQCVAHLAALAQYEHRAKSCTPSTVSDNGKVTVINYTCAGSDFGRTSIKVVTPRNLRIETQGISDGLPFAYAIEARRVGECKSSGTAAPERGH